MKKYYFTNPTADRHQARVVQGTIERATGLILLNPFYDKYGIPTPEIAQLDAGEKTTISRQEIVHIDLKMVKDSDGIIGWLTNNTNWGSIGEVYVCYREYNKPVYLISDVHSRFKGTNIPTHPFLLEHCTKCFLTIEEFVEYAKENLCH